jgi:hypothetical protein
MTHRKVGGDQTRTRYTAAPFVTVRTKPNDYPTLVLEFPSSLVSAPGPTLTTRLEFVSVFEYRFIATDSVYFPTDQEDHAFALIEILDSQLKERLLSRSKYQSFTPGERLGGVVTEADLRHYRIGFDEHGHYDVLSLGVDIQQTSQER